MGQMRSLGKRLAAESDRFDLVTGLSEAVSSSGQSRTSCLVQRVPLSSLRFHLAPNQRKSSLSSWSGGSPPRTAACRRCLSQQIVSTS